MATHRFDRFVLDEEAGELREDGRLVHLQPKAFELAALLCANPGRLFSREELFARLWPGVHVSDDSLTQAVGRVRRAVGPEWLQTVPRRGYRWGAPVAPADRAGDLVGRTDLLEQVRALLAPPGALVTLHGPGGIGKTTLARAVAPRATWVDLASARTADDVVVALAAAVGAELSQGADAARALAGVVAGRTLVLDEAEVVAEAVASLLPRLGSPRALVTSRRLLDVRGERVVELGPLSAAEARELWARIAPPPEDEEALAALLARLDHHPLAIELAAARAPILGLDGLARRIARHGTSGLDREASIDRIARGSWALLSEAARRAAAALAALPAPLAADDLERLDPGSDWLDELDELRRHAWIRAETGRWRMPPPLAEWVRAHGPPTDAADRFLRDVVARRHEVSTDALAWALDRPGLAPADVARLASAVLPRLPRTAPASRRLATARQGIAAIEAGAEVDAVDAARLELAAATEVGNAGNGPLALAWLERAATRELPDALRAEVRGAWIARLAHAGRMEDACLEAAALLAWARPRGADVLAEALPAAIGAARIQGGAVEALIDEGIEASLRSGRPRLLVWMHMARAQERFRWGEWAEARLQYEVVRELAEREGFSSIALDAELGAAHAVGHLGQVDEARARLERVAERAERIGLVATAMKARGNLGQLLDAADHPDAERVLLRALGEATALGLAAHVDTARINLGGRYLRRGDREAAVASFTPAASSATPRLRQLAIVGLARAALEGGDRATAQRLLDGIGEAAVAEVAGEIAAVRARLGEG